MKLTTNSLWKKIEHDLNYPNLQKDIYVFVAIIGGGITGKYLPQKDSTKPI